LDITRLIIIQVVAQVISSEMFLTAPALQITIVAAIILLIAPVAGVPVALALEAQVRQEVVVEALHP
jgi:hypothetical protein